MAHSPPEWTTDPIISTEAIAWGQFAVSQHSSMTGQKLTLQHVLSAWHIPIASAPHGNKIYGDKICAVVLTAKEGGTYWAFIWKKVTNDLKLLYFQEYSPATSA